MKQPTPTAASADLRMAAARVDASCTCFALRRAARAVAQLYDDALRPSGLRNTQFTLLALLAGHGAMSVGALAEASGTDRTTLTRNLAVLERAGFVGTHDDRIDARVRLVDITRVGRERLRAAIPLWERAQSEMEARVGGELLTRVRDGLADVVDGSAPAP